VFNHNIHPLITVLGTDHVIDILASKAHSATFLNSLY